MPSALGLVQYNTLWRLLENQLMESIRKYWSCIFAKLATCLSHGVLPTNEKLVNKSKIWWKSSFLKLNIWICDFLTDGPQDLWLSLALKFSVGNWKRQRTLVLKVPIRNNRKPCDDDHDNHVDHNFHDEKSVDFINDYFLRYRSLGKRFFAFMTVAL